MADLADHAYSHALALVGDAGAAADVARRGLLRGGRSRVAVLGHTRAAGLAAGSPGDAAGTPLESVTDVALALAGRRPAVERAVVDLEFRHGLTRGGFARAVGLSPAAAGARASEVAASWAAELDPALLAWLGPGDCEGMAALLDPLAADAPDLDIDGFLALAPDVAAHAAECPPCGDRLRAMVSVRSVVGQLPLSVAPDGVRAAGRAARRRPPVPPPPLGDQRARLWVRYVLTAAVAVAVAVVGVGVASLVDRDGGGRDERVEALTARPAGQGALVLSSSTFDATTHSVTLTNRSGRSVRWEAAATVPWLRTAPPAGELGAGQSVEVRLVLTEAAPEGEISGTLSFSAPDGSTASMAGAGTIERAPDVAAHREGCEVMATAEDEGRVAAVVLHWRVGPPGSAEATDEMQPAGPAAGSGAGSASASDSGYHGALPPTATAWWVTAADGRGNVSHTPEEAVAGPAC